VLVEGRWCGHAFWDEWQVQGFSAEANDSVEARLGAIRALGVPGAQDTWPVAR
jgi:hypothetical protein